MSVFLNPDSFQEVCIASWEPQAPCKAEVVLSGQQLLFWYGNTILPIGNMGHLTCRQPLQTDCSVKLEDTKSCNRSLKIKGLGSKYRSLQMLKQNGISNHSQIILKFSTHFLEWQTFCNGQFEYMISVFFSPLLFVLKMKYHCVIFVSWH